MKKKMEISGRSSLFLSGGCPSYLMHWILLVKRFFLFTAPPAEVGTAWIDQFLKELGPIRFRWFFKVYLKYYLYISSSHFHSHQYYRTGNTYWNHLFLLVQSENCSVVKIIAILRHTWAHSILKIRNIGQSSVVFIVPTIS